jgi:hypothetical protein
MARSSCSSGWWTVRSLRASWSGTSWHAPMAASAGPTSSSTDRVTSTSPRMASCRTPPQQSSTAVRFAIVPQRAIAMVAHSKCSATPNVATVQRIRLDHNASTYGTIIGLMAGRRARNERAPRPLKIRSVTWVPYLDAIHLAGERTLFLCLRRRDLTRASLVLISPPIGTGLFAITTQGRKAPATGAWLRPVEEYPSALDRRAHCSNGSSRPAAAMCSSSPSTAARQPTLCRWAGDKPSFPRTFRPTTNGNCTPISFNALATAGSRRASPGSSCTKSRNTARRHSA